MIEYFIIKRAYIEDYYVDGAGLSTYYSTNVLKAKTFATYDLAKNRIHTIANKDCLYQIEKYFSISDLQS